MALAATRSRVFKQAAYSLISASDMTWRDARWFSNQSSAGQLKANTHQQPTQLVIQPSNERFVGEPIELSNGRRAFLVDTLKLVRKLEKEGLTAMQAEAITAVITEVLNDSLETVSHTFVSRQEMQRRELMQEAVLSKLRTEIVSQQEHHVSTSQREMERLRTDLDKLRSELKYEIDKVTAGQRLDLNLERGRIRDELASQSTQTAELTNKLDREIHALKTQLEAAKYDVIKYCIGCIVSVTAVGLGLIRILM